MDILNRFQDTIMKESYLLLEFGRRNQKKEQRKIEAVRKKEKRSKGRNPERSRTTC